MNEEGFEYWLWLLKNILLVILFVMGIVKYET